MREEARMPAVAGTFYPGDAKTLSRQVQDFLSRVPKESVPGEIIALVSPHAGYMYSGQVAAHAYKLVAGTKFDAVVVFSPSHRYHLSGGSVYASGSYETPLGSIPIEKDLCQRLMEESSLIRFIPKAHSQEHSLEVQLPFLQETIGPFRLVPIIIGDQSFQTCEEIGQATARVLRGKKALLVASTDLSHYHPYEEAVKLDQIVLDHLRAFDPRKLGQDLGVGRMEACGGGPVIAAMVAAKELGADHAQVLKYLNSGDVTGDRSGVVGYAAAVFFRTQKGLENGR